MAGVCEVRCGPDVCSGWVVCSGRATWAGGRTWDGWDCPGSRKAAVGNRRVLTYWCRGEEAGSKRDPGGRVHEDAPRRADVCLAVAGAPLCNLRPATRGARQRERHAGHDHGLPVPDAVRERILAEKDPARLERLHERAIVAASIAEILDEPS